MPDDSRQPMTTYRLQFNQEFRLTDAQSLVTYFSRLGVTHIYASPLLRARQASTHGYDVVDPTTINPSLGNMADLVGMVTELRKFGLGLFLDIVPNHMAASIENPYWRDVLTYGPSSPFARWFDIDWRLPDPDMWGRVLVPVLGEPRLRVLERDQIRLAWSDGRFLLQYFDHNFPVDPATVPAICVFGWTDLVQCLGPESSVLDKMRDILTRLKKLPKLVFRLRRQVDIDREQAEGWLAEFAQLVVQSPTIQGWAEQTADGFGRGGDGHRRLRKLLDSQPYRLVHWREAAQRINYRRFFDINDLVSVRQEDPHVFDATHTVILRLVEDGLLDGVRIDHIDGLRDPLGYLKRLTGALADRSRSRRLLPVFVEKILAPEEKLPPGWPVAGTTGYEFLNQVEAVFVSRAGHAELEEQYRRALRRPVRFHEIAAWGKRRVLRNELSPQVNRLTDALLRLWEDTGSRLPAVAAPEDALAAEAGTDQAGGSAETKGDPAIEGVRSATTVSPGRAGLTKRGLIDAIVEVIVALPVYRTYVDANSCTISDADRTYVETALQGARCSGRAPSEAIDFLGEVLLLEGCPALAERDRTQCVNFIQRFQQLTGPAAAKGIEDTAFYAYVPLVSLNEVGGEPHLGAEDVVAALHRANDERATIWPHTMLCVATHDTKRTADVRARLDVLSELPDVWADLVARWRRAHHAHGTRVGGKRAPDAADEYLFYQTVVGLWPAPDLHQGGTPGPGDATSTNSACLPLPPERFQHPGQLARLPSDAVLVNLAERVEAYMVKAAREAKTHTSWTHENREYEDTLKAFVRNLLRPAGNGHSRFLSEANQLVARIARPGFWNSLSRTLIQYTAPGTPDLYQGDELWNFALVDPDNRRPIDYERRRQLLDEVITGIEGPDESRREFLRLLVTQPEDGRVKLHVIRCALAARRDYPRVFAAGQYLPLAVDGPAREHVVAFARAAHPHREPAENGGLAEQAAIVVVPRLTARLSSAPFVAPIGDAVWADTVLQLPEPLQNRDWTCVLTRESVSATGGKSFALAQVLRLFPAALLVNHV